MRRYNFGFVIIIVILFSTACSKKKSSPGAAADTSSYSMSATIIKQSDTTTFSVAGQLWVTALYKNDTCKIVAMDTAGHNVVSQFIFYLYPYSGAYTYGLDSASYNSINNIVFAEYETSTPFYMQTAFDSCRMKITSATSKTISGTFNGTLTDGSVINNGSFTASFKENDQ